MEGNCSRRGVATHIKQRVDLEAICEATAGLAQLVEKAVMVGITEYFDVWRIGAGEITEGRVKDMVASAVATAIRQNTEGLMEQFDNKLDSLGSAFGQASGSIGAGAAGAVETANSHISTASMWRNT